MMGQRLALHEMLCGLLGTRHVYFQPPANIRMVYPCIVYKRTKINTGYADDKPYSHQKQYTLTVIDANPDSQIPDRVSNLPKCKHDTQFVSANLYHDVFTINY